MWEGWFGVSIRHYWAGKDMQEGGKPKAEQPNLKSLRDGGTNWEVGYLRERQALRLRFKAD